MDIEDEKKIVAKKALKFVKPSTIVGLGSGSTAAYFIEALGKLAKKKKLKIKCVATSKESERIAKKVGLKIVALEKADKIDVDIDGADKIDNQRIIIKGMGGALTREKYVASISRKFVVIADHRKFVKDLRKEKVIVPVEVLPFAVNNVKKELKKLGAKTKMRKKNKRIFVTDNGNYIIDSEFRKIKNFKKMAVKLNNIPGVVENGIFLFKGVKVIRPKNLF